MRSEDLVFFLVEVFCSVFRCQYDVVLSTLIHTAVFACVKPLYKLNASESGFCFFFPIHLLVFLK